MTYPSIPVAQTIILHCKAKGIKNIVISPGSRNAPLTIGFTENPFFKCFSIVDERSAAFFALGMAQQIRQPVALVCTSGSALLNYYPAIAEAFYSNIPLVIVSADRPSYKIDVGDGQTIRQDNVFHRHIGYSANLKQDVVHATDRIRRYSPQMIAGQGVDVSQEAIDDYNNTELNNALNLSLTKGLPVHINVPFEEPLYDKTAEKTVVPNIIPSICDIIEFENLLEYVNIWNAASRKLVLVGVNHPNSIEQKFLDTLAKDPSVIVMTESTSNLHHPNFFPSIDSLVAPIELSNKSDELFLKLQPEILLTFGGLIVSKKIKAFLRAYKPKKHWHIDPFKAYNTFFALERHFRMGINDFFKQFIPHLKPVKSGYYSYWHEKRNAYEQKREAYLKRIPFSDFSVFNSVCQNIPANYHVQLANSSTVRYAQLFNMNPTVKVFCNRGTSGIDGSTSTAVGASIYNETPTLLLTGDLSFLYDSNGLWNNYIKPDFKIILINNEGGGIFRILPGKEDTNNFETFFETVQQLDVSHLCNMYGLDYILVEDQNFLESSLKDFFQQKTGARLLEVRTPRIVNNKILLGYFDFIS